MPHARRAADRVRVYAAPKAREDSYRKRYRSIAPGFFGESPPVRAEEGAGSACPAGQPGRLNLHLCAAPWAAGDSYRKRYRSMARGFFWEVTRRRRELGAGSTRRAVPAFMRRHMAAGGSLWEAIRSMARGFFWEATLYQEKFARQDSGFLWEAIPFYSAGLLLGSDAPCRKKHVPRAREVS